MQQADIEVEPREQETATTTFTVDREMLAQHMQKGMQFVDLGFWLLYSLILLQIVLEALGAHDHAGFKRFLDGLTGPFLKPFEGLFSDPRLHNHEIMLSYIAAMVVYLILQGMIKRIVELVLSNLRQSDDHLADSSAHS